MKQIVLDKLQWHLLLKKLASFAQTPAGEDDCLNLKPNKSIDDINTLWAQVVPLRELIQSGYTPPIGETPILDDVFQACSVGQILDGESLRAVLSLLQTVKALLSFTRSMKDRCSTLIRFNSSLYSLPKLAEAIALAISPEGEILDTASAELGRIRKQKLSLRQTIEKDLKQILSGSEVETYLQDKFFTVRSDRYVVPIRVDGRGRVDGSIQDTSDSGQTLYIEPQSIKPRNDKLLELEINEKLEIARIFRELSEHTRNEIEIIRDNYKGIVELDILTSQARLAASIDSGSVKLTEEPRLDLRAARHPLVTRPDGKPAVANTISLEEKQRLLIVSGPNAGGKTIVLKTVGLLHIMVKAGLLIPADEESTVFLPDKIYLEMGDAQNLESNLSTFSGHVLGLKPILETAGPRDLVLLDELAVGTEPQTGSAIGQAVLEEIGRRQSVGIVTTHFDNLKSLAITNDSFRNGSMEYSMDKLLPTYRLVLDVPGQSRGLEVAEQMGLPNRVLDRAKELRGNSTSELDQIIEDMFSAKQQAEKEVADYKQLRLETEAEKNRWEQDRNELRATKAKLSEKVKNRYEDQIDSLRKQLNESLAELKSVLKKANLEADHKLRQSANATKKNALENLQNLDSNLQKLGDEFKVGENLPGKEVKASDLKVGQQVFVVSFQKEATVTKVSQDPLVVEVAMGLIKTKPPLHDLRLLSDKKASPTNTKKSRATKSSNDRSGQVSFTVPSSRNTLDLRGSDATGAIEKIWNFIDKAVLRGESSLIVIHGHGTATLKKTVRSALAKDSPYDLDFRPGGKEEGGDGVTVIQLQL